MAPPTRSTPPEQDRRELATRRSRKRRKHFGSPPTDEDWNPIDRRDDNRRFIVRREDDQLKAPTPAESLEDEYMALMSQEEESREEDSV